MRLAAGGLGIFSKLIGERFSRPKGMRRMFMRDAAVSRV